MKILQVNANYGFGSTGLIMRDIGNAIIRSGHEAYFAYQRTIETPLNGYVIGSKYDWKRHAIQCRLLGRQGFYSDNATKKFIKYMEEIKPDVVHLHNLHSNFINIEILFSYLAKADIATVITMHDCWFFTGKCFHYIDCGCDKFISGCGNCPKKNAPPSSFFFDRSSKDWKTKNDLLHSIPRIKIVGCSSWIIDEAGKGFLKDCDLRSIYNGVDITVFTPKYTDLRHELGISENDYVILGMANKWLQPRNLQLISKVASIQGIKLIILGCTESDINKVRQLAPTAVPIGFVRDRIKLSEYYNTADVFINLTHADTLPTVNMESICCGTPVITYRTSGSTELVLPRTGIVVEEDDQDAIVNAISIVKHSSFSDCAVIGARNYDMNVCYNKYVELYNSIFN